MSHIDPMTRRACDGYMTEDRWCVLCGAREPAPEPPAEVERPVDPVLAWLEGKRPMLTGSNAAILNALIARRRAELEGRHDAR